MRIAHIVIPVDFSPACYDALKVAAVIARHEKSDIHLVHVYEKPYTTVANAGGGMSATVDVRELERIKYDVQQEVEKLAKIPEAAGLKLHFRLLSDIPVYDFWQKFTDAKHPCDLIIMGTTGNTSLLKPGEWFGTNAERVMQRAPVPILSVPKGTVLAEIQEVLFATDFEDNIDSFYPFALSMAKSFGAKLFVGTVNTKQDSTYSLNAKSRYDALARQYPYEKLYFVEQMDKDVEKGIIQMVIDKEIDLVCMLTHGHTGFLRFLHTRVSEKLTQHMKKPLLTYRQPNE